MTDALPRWTEVRVAVPHGWEELVADGLGAYSTAGVVIGGREAPDGHELVRGFVEDERDDAALRDEIRVALSELARRTAAEELADLTVEFRPLPPEDWATSWQKVWRPFRVGRLCVVRPSTEATLRPDDVRLELEPGAVFGSGRHATTRHCLRVLQERGVVGARVLDAGTGTGILAVAAALLGAREVLGFDTDANSPRAAAALARANGVADACAFREGDFSVLGDADASYDVCLANIYSDVIREHARDLRARLRPGGWFAFSGCPAHHEDATAEAIGAAGLTLESIDRRGNWRTFSGHRP